MATLFSMMEEDEKRAKASSRSGAPASDALSVTAALNLAKRSLESVRVKVIGEVSEVSNKPGYKAIYFTLSDKDCAMPCLMWRNDFDRARIEITRGALVEVTGKFSMYQQKGRMNFVASSISLAGEGELRMRVDQLARKLQAEGLMDPARKKPIPDWVSKVAVVTSPRGKAIHDVLRTLRRRCPQVAVYVVGVPVEGDIAPASICQGLEVAEQSDCDVILLVRGGGSYEDLMPFNDERVARCVASCRKPVVTGIGHEPDNSIADMVGDRRCSTPTAAAESVTEDISELARQLENAKSRMATALSAKVNLAQAHVGQIASRPLFKDPQFLTANLSMRLDVDAERLSSAIPNAIESDLRSIERARASLCRIGARMLEKPESEISMKASRLNDLSPLAVLGRGYAIAYDDEGRVVSSIDKVEKDDLVKVRVADGMIDCTVIDTERKGI